MARGSNSVLQQKGSPTEARIHDALVAGLGRVAAVMGRGALADASERTTRSLDMLFSGESKLPDLKRGLDFLMADETALDEVLALYGVSLCRRHLEPTSDMQMLADMAAAMSRFADIMADGVRKHPETLSLAPLFRQLMPRMAAVIAEADELRGVKP